MTESLSNRDARYLVDAGTSILSEPDMMTEHMTSGATHRLVAVVVRRDLPCTVISRRADVFRPR